MEISDSASTGLKIASIKIARAWEGCCCCLTIRILQEALGVRMMLRGSDQPTSRLRFGVTGPQSHIPAFPYSEAALS